MVTELDPMLDVARLVTVPGRYRAAIRSSMLAAETGRRRDRLADEVLPESNGIVRYHTFKFIHPGYVMRLNYENTLSKSCHQVFGRITLDFSMEYDKAYRHQINTQDEFLKNLYRAF